MSSYMVSDTIESMKGKKLSNVRLENDKEAIVFEFEDGTSSKFGVEGDCCSRSWIEHLEVPKDLKGATFLEFAEDSMDATDDDSENPVSKSWGGREHECLRVYSSRYRNSSNGYYGGYLVTYQG